MSAFTLGRYVQDVISGRVLKFIADAYSHLRLADEAKMNRNTSAVRKFNIVLHSYSLKIGYSAVGFSFSVQFWEHK